MKKLLFILSVSFLTMSFLPTLENIDTLENKIEKIECKYRQCNATAKSTGNRCKHCVSSNDDYQCWQHKPNE